MKTRLDETNQMRKLMDLPLITESSKDDNCLSEDIKYYLNKYGYEQTDRFEWSPQSPQEPRSASTTYSPIDSICYVQKKSCKVEKDSVTDSNGNPIPRFSKIHLEFFNFTPECGESFTGGQSLDFKVIVEFLDSEGNVTGASADVNETTIINDSRGVQEIQKKLQHPNYSLNGIEVNCF